MNANTFIPLLGLPVSDPKIKKFLSSLGFDPNAKLKKSDASAFVVDRKHGIELMFKDERHLDVHTREYDQKGVYVLDVIWLFDQTAEWHGNGLGTFSGKLPYGLRFGQTPKEVVANIDKNSSGKYTSKAGFKGKKSTREGRVFEDFILSTAYSEEGKLIEVTLHMPQVPSKKHVELAKQIRIKANSAQPMPDIDWDKTYQTLGIKTDIQDLWVKPKEGYWDIYVAKGLTLNKIVATFRNSLKVKVFPNGLEDNEWDKEFPKHDRSPSKGPYRIRVKKNIEGDIELYEMSARDLAKKKIKGITLLERMILELGYYLATKLHLNPRYQGLCSGTRSKTGETPSVHWIQAYPKEINISSSPTDFAHKDILGRKVQA